MVPTQKTISHAHLHAYVDNELKKQKRADVTKYLESHPSFLTLVKDYQDINSNLHKLFDVVINEPIPEKLLQSMEFESVQLTNREASGFSFAHHKLFIVIFGMVLGSIIGVALHKSHELKLLSKAAYIVETFISRFI